MSGKDSELLQFPCDFPVKVMGKNCDDFFEQIKSILLTHFVTLSSEEIKQKLSKGDKYLSVSVTVPAQSKKQLDDLYRELTSHPQVIMAL